MKAPYGYGTQFFHLKNMNSSVEWWWWDDLVGMTLPDLELLSVPIEMVVAVVRVPERIDALRVWTRAEYRSLARSCHPDLGGDVDAFRTLTAARDRVLHASVADLTALLGLDDWYERARRARAMRHQIDAIMARSRPAGA